MTPEMVTGATKAFRPRVHYPYPYGKAEPTLLLDLMKNDFGSDVHIVPLR